jgi:Fe-S-cluster-containing dehydrogenase component
MKNKRAIDSVTLDDQKQLSKLSLILEKSASRRNFLKIMLLSGCTLITTTTILKKGFAQVGTWSADAIWENSKGIILRDPSRCVGCRRCECACTEFNDGKTHPAISRIKVARNFNFGPEGVFVGEEGELGNFLIIQDTCCQCPHPIPCMSVCQHDAIEIVPPINARVINIEKCIGCGLCIKACPWEMISIDQNTNKATKCFLCNGQPECVKACPTGSLRYSPWLDITDKIPIRSAGLSTPINNSSCASCH